MPGKIQVLTPADNAGNQTLLEVSSSDKETSSHRVTFQIEQLYGAFFNAEVDIYNPNLQTIQKGRPKRFSLAYLGFSFLFSRGIQTGYFSFHRERSEIMKVDELLISAKELPWQKPISLCPITAQ